MSRFIQEDNRPAPKQSKEEPRVLAGSKEYDYSRLSEAKKIVTPNGGKR